MTNKRLRPPPTGLALWPLVEPHRKAVNARVPLAASLMDVDVDALVVQVGPSVPYRLLVLHSEADGLIRVCLWEVRKRLEVVVEEKLMSDLVGDRVKKMGVEFGLSV